MFGFGYLCVIKIISFKLLLKRTEFENPKVGWPSLISGRPINAVIPITIRPVS